MTFSLLPPTSIASALFFVGILLLIFWELLWKGIALWNAARNGQRFWYIAILVLNTAGILPIVYLLLFQDKK